MLDTMFFFCCAAPENINQHDGDLSKMTRNNLKRPEEEDEVLPGPMMKDLAAFKNKKGGKYTGFSNEDILKEHARTNALVASESSTFTAKLDCSQGEHIGVKIFLMEPDNDASRKGANLAVWRFPLLASLEGRSISLTCNLTDARSVPLSMKPVARDEDAIIGSVTEGGAVGVWNSACPESQVIKPGDRIVEVNGEGGSAEDIARKLGAVSDQTNIELLIQRPRVLTVKIQKCGEPLGLDLKYIDAPFGLMISHIKDGLIRDWNTDHPTSRINAYDRIVSVNGKTENPEKLIDMLKRSEDLEVKVMSWPTDLD
eukprot:TRINITY_DN10568_c1_g2_i3.p1 TRINITY_DN10568_c1_g2~~TRINITY_DN10568_c1_g2_i3.p1  ORF type:complete len:313 (+),score=65.65 TRINITY_DN10568_c1_g2_i3:42-980(+)